MYNIYYIESNELNNLFHKLKQGCNLFSPAVKDPHAPEIDYQYKHPTDSESLIFNTYRIAEPLKSFFTAPKEAVAEYFSQGKTITDLEKIVIFGLKNCDISSHKIQDFVFLEGLEVDSLYRIKRENTILISSDCTAFKKVCFCLALDVLPYPSAGFDLNLSPLNDGYVLEVGSPRGEEFIQQYKDYFSLAKETQVTARQIKRDNLVERLKKHLLPQNLPLRDNLQKLVKDGYTLDTWQNFMLTCVECAGCNFICNTCHCFLLADKKENQGNVRLKLWDSCQYANFSRVAGGVNPLKTRAQRLRNRFMKKFDFFVDNLGMPACCGCGRCIEVCPGKIDIREVLKDLAKKVTPH